MYFITIFALTLVLPMVSVGIEFGLHSESPVMPLVGKWFTFWAVGIRLTLTGLRQMIQPRYTAQVILGLKGDESLLVVRELGFANFSFGVLGLGCFAIPAWVTAGALVAGVFYGLAGGNHAGICFRSFGVCAFPKNSLSVPVLGNRWRD